MAKFEDLTIGDIIRLKKGTKFSVGWEDVTSLKGYIDETVVGKVYERDPDRDVGNFKNDLRITLNPVEMEVHRAVHLKQQIDLIDSFKGLKTEPYCVKPSDKFKVLSDRICGALSLEHIDTGARIGIFRKDVKDSYITKVSEKGGPGEST